MSYEESQRDCPSCQRPTWHGRDVVDVFRPKKWASVSLLICVFNDLVIPWRCLDCGRRTWRRAETKAIQAPGKSG